MTEDVGRSHGLGERGGDIEEARNVVEPPAGDA
jgi:hypothetical protein